MWMWWEFTKEIASVFMPILMLLTVGAMLGAAINEATHTPEADIRERIYREAIQAGAATRVVDQETGEVRIEWRTGR